MNLEDKELSIQLYHDLCDIIGSKDVVKTRRKIFFALETVLKDESHTFISSGSKAEGLDLNGSDYDQMIVFNDVGVYENIHDVYPSHGLTLLMDTTDTKPGFTKLKVIKSYDSYSSRINEWSYTVKQPIFIASKLFRDFLLHSVQKQIDCIKIHGPCLSPNNETFDCVQCFRCKECIIPVKQWIDRYSITHDNALAQSIVQYGVLFVPIGNKDSVNEDLEWRISFSVAEKQLILSFSHTQLLCYALLKIVLKDVIKKEHKELICSYFLKTIMFWLSEEIFSSKWTPENFNRCFMSCWKRLIYCVKYETCLHYFIPDNNLFETRFTYAKHKALLNTLYAINDSAMCYIFNSATFENYRREQRNSYLPHLTASSLPCLVYCQTAIQSKASSLSLRQLIIHTANERDRHIYKYILSTYVKMFMQQPDFINIKKKNKPFYRQYRKFFRVFQIGVYIDAVHAWALLASLFYKLGRYKECIDIIDYSLSKCTPDKIRLTLDNDLEEQSRFQKLKQMIGLSLTCKHFLIDSINFKTPFILLPTELFPLSMKRKYIPIPPVVYLQLLHFFCLHHLGDSSGKAIVYRDLESTLRERYFIQLNETNLTMMIICRDIAKSM